LFDDYKYVQLHQEYLELQSRVTKFSSTQQELIKTRDILDQELVRYKRLNEFFSKAIRIGDIEVLLRLTCEAVIDVFELQISYISFHKVNSDDDEKELVFCEGVGLPEKKLVHNDLEKLESVNIYSGVFKQFDEDEIELYIDDPYLSFVLLSKRFTFNGEFTLLIGAAVDGVHKESYDVAVPTKISLFSIFLQQVEAIINNLLTLTKNKEQLLLIKQSEVELQKLSLIATSTNNAVIITDAFGRIEWINEAFTILSGYKIEEVKGKKPKDFLQINDKRTEKAREMLSLSLSKKEFIEVNIINRSKNGTEYTITLQITPVFDKNGELINFIALQKDITEELRQRNELEKMNFRLNEITKGSKVGIWEFNPEKNEEIWNEVLYELYEVDPLSDLNLHKVWRDSLHPDDTKSVLEGIQRLIKGEQKENISEYRVIVGPEKKLKHVRTIAFYEVYNEFENRILGSTTEITETKNHERQLMLNNTELKKINSELDQFVYSVSHDLRAPLLSVKGLLTLIHIPEGDVESTQYMELIYKSIDRLDDTVKEILEYSRNARKEIELTDFDLHKLVSDVFSDLRHLSNNNVSFETHPDGPFIINHDKKRIEKVLYNLIGNGLKYRKVGVSDSFVHVKMEDLEDYFTIEVVDNGEGIATEDQEKVFDMFYRASVSSSGTGLGLYLCKELINKMKGEIRLNSRKGFGTQIKVTLPKSYSNE
jgi:PAS domain S-box-containing protein